MTIDSVLVSKYKEMFRIQEDIIKYFQKYNNYTTKCCINFPSKVQEKLCLKNKISCHQEKIKIKKSLGKRKSKNKSKKKLLE
jgi:hypothetical protein